MKLIDYLNEFALGKENAISMRELASKLNYPNERALRKEVTVNRKKGNVIMSCVNGYYIPTQNVWGELERQKRLLGERIKMITAMQRSQTLDGQVKGEL